MRINFAYNPTSWRDDAPVPGGMADALVRPILPHLETDYILTNRPLPDSVNVLYSHWQKYGKSARMRKVPSVFISHGIADKAWRDGSKMRGLYTSVFVSGPAWTNRLRRQNVHIGIIREVGYTKLDPIFNGEVKPLRPRDGRIRVVWAPTHGGGGERGALRPADAPPEASTSPLSTWGHRSEVLDLLPESEFDVIEAPHPRHRPDRRSTLAEYVDADVVIADGGSTIYESWALDLPVVFPDWLVADAIVSRWRVSMSRPATFERQLYEKRVGRHAVEPDELAKQVVDAASGGITAKEQAFIEPILPRAYRGVSGRMHAEALDEIARC